MSERYWPCRSRQQLSNEYLFRLVHVFTIYIYLLAKIGVDTAENESLKVWRRFDSFIHSPLYSAELSLLHPDRILTPARPCAASHPPMRRCATNEKDKTKSIDDAGLAITSLTAEVIFLRNFACLSFDLSAADVLATCTSLLEVVLRSTRGISVENFTTAISYMCRLCHILGI